MIIQGSQERMIEKAAWILFKMVESLLKKQKNVIIAVPGGRSVAAVFKLFCKNSLPWNQIHIFLLDERIVPPDHPESNYRLVKEHLGKCIPEEQIHQPDLNVKNPLIGIQRYYEKLQTLGGRFDLVLASSGEDGHIGSLFPHHPSIENTENGFILVDDSPKPPAQRMSASYALIREAETGVVLFLGESKRSALRNFYNIHLSPLECPAKIMTKLSRYYLLTDQEVETP